MSWRKPPNNKDQNVSKPEDKEKVDGDEPKDPTEVEKWLDIVKKLEEAKAPVASIDDAKKQLADARLRRDTSKSPEDQLKNVLKRITGKESQIKKTKESITDKEEKIKKMQAELIETNKKAQEEELELQELQKQKAALEASNNTLKADDPKNTGTGASLHCAKNAPEDIKLMFGQLNDLLQKVRASGYLLSDTSTPSPTLEVPEDDGSDDDMVEEFGDDMLKEYIGDDDVLKEQAKTPDGRAAIKKRIQQGWKVVNTKKKSKRSLG